MTTPIRPARHPRVEMNPAIKAGKPVILGTRITVHMILEELGSGMTPQEIVDEHPTLTLDDILAATSFAADYIRNDELIFG